MPYHGIAQATLTRKMDVYLRQEGRANEFELSDGYCHGLSLLIGYLTILGMKTGNFARLNELLHAINECCHWDEKSDKSKCFEFIFSSIGWTQENHKLLNLEQKDIAQAIDYIKDENDPGIQVEFNMGFVFRRDELLYLFSQILRDKKAFHFNSHNHAILVITDEENGRYLFYDSNNKDSDSTYPEGFVVYKNHDDLANALVTAFNLEVIRLAGTENIVARKEVNYVPLAVQTFDLEGATPASYPLSNEIIQALMARREARGLPAELDAIGWDNVNSMMMACDRDSISCLDEIIKLAQANPDPTLLNRLLTATDTNDINAIQYAISNNSLAAVIKLIECDAINQLELAQNMLSYAKELPGTFDGILSYLKNKILELNFANLKLAIADKDKPEFSNLFIEIQNNLHDTNFLDEYKAHFFTHLIDDMIANNFLEGLQFLEINCGILCIPSLPSSVYQPALAPEIKRMINHHQQIKKIRDAIENGDITFLASLYRDNPEFLNETLGANQDFPLVYALKINQTTSIAYLMSLPNTDKDKMLQLFAKSSALQHFTSSQSTSKAFNHPIQPDKFALQNAMENHSYAIAFDLLEQDTNQTIYYFYGLLEENPPKNSKEKQALHGSLTKLMRRYIDEENLDEIKKLLHLTDILNIEMINARSADGMNTLHYACQHGSVSIIKCLLKNHGNLNLTTSDDASNTPLHIAAQHNHFAAVHLLVTHGAKAETLNAAGKPALNPLNYNIKLQILELLSAIAKSIPQMSVELKKHYEAVDNSSLERRPINMIKFANSKLDQLEKLIPPGKSSWFFISPEQVARKKIAEVRAQFQVVQHQQLNAIKCN